MTRYRLGWYFEWRVKKDGAMKDCLADGLSDEQANALVHLLLLLEKLDVIEWFDFART